MHAAERAAPAGGASHALMHVSAYQHGPCLTAAGACCVQPLSWPCPGGVARCQHVADFVFLCSCGAQGCRDASSCCNACTSFVISSALLPWYTVYMSWRVMHANIILCKLPALYVCLQQHTHLLFKVACTCVPLAPSLANNLRKYLAASLLCNHIRLLCAGPSEGMNAFLCTSPVMHVYFQ